MRTIENVETIGVYHDEIRILSKDREPVTINRSTHRLSVSDVVRVEDITGDRRLALHMKDGVHCTISDTVVKCGLFIGRRD